MSTPETDPLVIRERLTELFKHPNLLPENLLSFLVDYLAVNMPEIPIGHIIGSEGKNVTGIIPATGTTPTAGTGFTYTHTNGTGIYVFTFTTAFAAAPIILAMGNSTTVSGIINADNISGTGFRVYTLDSTGAYAEQPFNFTAQAVS